MEKFKEGDLVDGWCSESQSWTDMDYVYVVDLRVIANGYVPLPHVLFSPAASQTYRVNQCRHRRPDLKKNDPVWCGPCNLPRHFKEWADDGSIVVYGKGGTSHSTKDTACYDEYRTTPPEEAG